MIKFYGYHKYCGGRVINHIQRGYLYLRCSSCLDRITNTEEVVAEQPYKKNEQPTRPKGGKTK